MTLESSIWILNTQVDVMAEIALQHGILDEGMGE